MSRVRPLRWLATAYVGLVRGTPLITQIFIIYFGLAYVVTLPAFWAGALASSAGRLAYQPYEYRPVGASSDMDRVAITAGFAAQRGLF